MERFRLKNIIILILVLLNAFLLFSLAQRRAEDGSSADIHEKDARYLAQCLELGHKAAAHYGWTVIDFRKAGAIRSAEEKHEEIYRIVKEVLAGA